MSHYWELINKLIKDEDKKGMEEFCFITIYLPGENGDSAYFKKAAKSLVLSNINGHGDLNKKNTVKDQLIGRINSEIDKIVDFKKGMAIFSKIEVNNTHNPVASINITPLSRSPNEDVFIDAVYDLDQLVWMENTISSELVVVLNEGMAKFYISSDSKLELIKEEENQMVPEDSKESMNIFRSAGGIREKEEMGVRDGLLVQVIKSLKNGLNNLPDFDYIVIIYSSSFNDLIKPFSDKLSRIFNKQHQCVLINKNVTNYQEIKEAIYEKMDIAKEKEKTESFSKIKEKDYKNFTDDWRDILKYVREKRVEKLFVRPAIQKDGYLTGNGDVYGKPREGARKVRNIIPWIIKGVIQSSGKVIIFEKEEEGIPEIAVQLRF